ncbi:hypothetical protein [Brevibacterium jeotgali]|uniref:Flp pilus-assembly TadE/G-like n=1 Tax=Brevibacterium jeotgali TaxID=1262550 RepID=A0A2H1L8V3_9MICO|nr:hypothetical protein [Brevibacterium jeotgali]TWB98548.1 hypothetical protein FB108_2438 [Brevibacterium jeotgali]SMY13289.1 hypothetical protein BJEO58_02905 [Brevibacterium jeotgali]
MRTLRVHVGQLRQRTREDGETGQVAIGVLLTTVVVIAATFAFMVFAEAVDLRSSTQKGADAAATSAAETARSTWIEAWLRAQKASPQELPSDDSGDNDRTDDEDEGDEDEDEEEFQLDHVYSPPEPFWAGSVAAAMPAAADYAAKNDGGTLTRYLPEHGNRISVDVHRSKETSSRQGSRFVPSIGGDSSATAQVVTPAGLTCAPLPGGMIEAWTLQCTSAKGSARAYYTGNVLVSWEESAFERMYTIRLDR